MSISALFPGMEAYLDGDVEINNNVTTPEEDAAHEVEAADQTADIATDVGEVETDVKNDDVATQMLLRTGRLYYHVKQFGVDRTFLRLYNQHGEMDRMCGIQFPSCEAMNATGNPYSRYSAAFIAAMEDDDKGFWATIWQKIKDCWAWITTRIVNIWKKIVGFFSKRKQDLNQLIADIEQNYNLDDTVKISGSLKAATNRADPPAKLLADRFSAIDSSAAKIFATVDKLNQIDSYDEIDNDIAQFDSVSKKPESKDKADNSEISVTLREVVDPVKEYAKVAGEQLKRVDYLQKQSASVLKTIEELARKYSKGYSGADAKTAKQSAAKFALSMSNFVKKINGVVVAEGKAIDSTINNYCKELRRVIKQLKPKEKPADNAGGNASDKSGGDKNATAMFAFL